MTQNDQPTAAFLIIGNEILSGRTQEKNLSVLATALAGIGVRMCEVRVIQDIIPVIVRHVNELRTTYDYVFTSGGIGPTHDDLTAEAIAEAFEQPLLIHPEANQRLVDHYQRIDIPYTENRQRMARVPQGGRLIDNPVSIAPGFAVENVFTMAGVPDIFAAMVTQILPELRHGRPIRSVTLTVFRAESEIAEDLGQVDARHPDVDIGCYPTWSRGRPLISIVARSTDETALISAEADLRQTLPVSDSPDSDSTTR